MTINSRLQLVKKSGKYVLGYKLTLKMISQDSQLCPAVQAHGNTVYLPRPCGKYYRVYTLTIIDPGDSDFLRSMQEQTSEKQTSLNFKFWVIILATNKNKSNKQTKNQQPAHLAVPKHVKVQVDK
uniref:Uncharacterized protein n=1 Tax=Podarcis muralis TaxID=64176 RepID=A0A670ISF2_PODMU